MRREEIIRPLKVIKKALSTPTPTSSPLVTDSTEYTQEALCSCRDSHGEIKTLYLSYQEAQEQIAHLQHHTTLSLTTYPCPHGFGVHLTKG